MNLVVVESPTKAKTIGRFLGSGYTIKASMGHIMDLPKSKLGVDTEKDFEPQYEVMPDKKKHISELKSAAKGVDTIILATDPDREGEAIASHVMDVLSSSLKLKVKSEKFKRIVFHEITKEAVEEALTHPGVVNKDLVNAQTARRVLDRLVGYKLSPLLWQKVRRGLSAGRVQSVALRLIVEREKEIEKFKKENYWTVHVILSKAKDLGTKNRDSSPSVQNDNTTGVEFELLEIDNEKIEITQKLDLYDGEYTFARTILSTEQQANAVLQDLAGKDFVVADVTQKETRRTPAPPYTTSTLQQDASRRLFMPGRKTMSIAQKLYEEGYITYHRTDSVTMASSAQGAILGFVEKEFGKKYVQPRTYTTKQKLAQEAHEAIRPTKVTIKGDVVTKDLGAQYGKLYELIWRRAIATQMADALIESTSVLVDSQVQSSIHSTSSGQEFKVQSGPVTYRFKANGSVLVFDGFLKVNPTALMDKKLPGYVAADVLKSSETKAVPHETTPPPRYNDASLIKTLEEKGIGRPSTYATIIATIEGRKYIERVENRFTPTSIGVAVTDFLVTNFADIDDIPFTAEMEDTLDEIAGGKKEWKSEIKKFYSPFEKQLDKVKETAKRVKIEVEELDEKCPECGSPLVIRMGRFGKFISCSTFPACKFTKQFMETTGKVCPKDGGQVIVKRTRKGRTFFGCSNYPKCDFASWKLENVQ